ncbi:MAG: hypothetical protein ACKVQS_07095 [Fimbriimonadaceae bacterium]
MIPTAKIRVFGKLQIWDQNGTAIQLTTKKTGLLLATLLIANAPKTRSDLAEAIWPDSPPEKARLSLRTAIAQLRKTLGSDILLTQTDTIELDRNSIESDLFQARRLQRLINIAKGGAERQSFQEQLAALTNLPFFESLTSDFIVDERNFWLNLRKTTLLDLADSLIETGMNESALIHANSALKIDRFDEKSIEKNLRILAHLGRTQDALKLSLETAKLFRKDLGLPLPKSIIDLTTEIKTGKVAPGAQPHALFNELIEKEMIVAMVESTVERDPDIIFKIFCDESFNPVALENLSGYVAILEKTLKETTGNSEPRIRAARMVARTAMMMSDYPKCFEWGKVVVDNTEESSQIHIATLDFLSSAYFNLQDYALAEELSERTYDLAEKHNFPVERNSALGNLAVYHLHQLKFEGVIEKAEQTLALILKENASPYRICSAYTLLASCHFAHNNFQKAIDAADKGIKKIIGSTYYLNGSNYCIKALSQAKLGNIKQSIPAAIEGLSICYAGNSVAVALSALEICCQLLVVANNPIPAIWIADATNELRNATDYPRTPLVRAQMADETLTNKKAILNQARSTNRLLNQPLSTLVEFTLDELERTKTGY